jgi:methyl-accepting chemotaxis protein
MTVSKQLWLRAILVVLVMTGMSTWQVLAKRDSMYAEKRLATRHVVEVAHGVLAHYQAEAASGRLTEADAKQRAARAVKEMRYEGSEYLWINDLKPRMIMHPTRPALDGTDLSGFKDPNGKALFVAFADVVRADGAGFVDYLWPKPGADKPLPKVSYVKGFAPWGWVVGSGIYVDDVNAAFWADVRRVALVVALLAAFAVAMFGRFARALTRELGGEPAEVAEVAKRVAGGDLTHRVAVRDGDRTSLLAAMGVMTDNLRAVIARIRESAHAVSAASDDLAEGNSDLQQRTERQAEDLQQTAASMKELTVTVKQNADNAELADRVASTASAKAKEGGAVMDDVIATMEAIRASSSRIADIVGVIDDLAFQTNVLALNAAVEAARVGEQGAGFAVVAAEVRSLSQRSASAAKEIKELVGAAVGRIYAGSQQAEDAGLTMKEVVTSVQEVTDVVGQIALASAEQSQGIVQVNHAVLQMERVTQQNSAMAEESAAATQVLADQARALAGATSTFRVTVADRVRVPASTDGAPPQPTPADVERLAA